MIPSLDHNSKEVFLSHINLRRWSLLYWLLLIGISLALLSLPFIRLDIAVKSRGIVRPANERTEVKPLLSGIIDTLYYKEGEQVEQGSVIIRLQDNNTAPKAVLNAYEIKQRQQYIHDLVLLTSTPHLGSQHLASLQSPLYKQQVSRFLYQKTEQETVLRKTKKEYQIDSTLAADHVVAPKELFDKTVEHEKVQAAYSAFTNEQLSIWQQDLARYRLELSQLETQRRQLAEESKQYEVKAPVTGVIQGLQSRYAGSSIQAGETLCIISPETALIAECYVPTQDIGLLQPNQPVRFQVDAFDYNYFGNVTGRIVSIDNDYTLVDNKPVFKVRCAFDQTQLHLKNGFTGQLKKGLTLQARFLVTQRSAWQLLFDTIDDWLNPTAPSKP